MYTRVIRTFVTQPPDPFAGADGLGIAAWRAGTMVRQRLSHSSGGTRWSYPDTRRQSEDTQTRVRRTS